MQNQTSAAMAWARLGWRRIALIAASMVLALALIASLGSPTGQVSADADTEDGTELVAARSKRPSHTSDDLVQYMISRGPSWT